MSRRYEFAMQKHGKGQRKKRRNNFPIKELDLSTVHEPLINEPKESEYEASWRKDLFSPEDESSKEDYSAIEGNLPLTVHTVGIGEHDSNYIGQEFSGITDRISKLLTDYEAVYNDSDEQGYAAMQEHLSGQMAIESLLSDFKSLCREREELLYSLQDSFDMDEKEMLAEIERMNRKEHRQSVDVESAQKAIQETFQNVKDTTAKLKKMNKMMVELSKQGKATGELEAEKLRLEKELQMYKKMAVNQRMEIFNRRSSIRKDETQQWKLVAGEMVDMLNMVRQEGNLDKETLAEDLNRILSTLNTQTEYIDNLKKDLRKQEKTVRNLEKDKTRVNNDKLLVEDELKTKKQELRQCKQYLRKVMAEKKDLGEKIKIDGREIDLTEGADEVKLDGLGEHTAVTDILQAQIRDARKRVFRLEEENRELQSKLASLPGGAEAVVDEKTDQQSTEVDRKEDIVKECSRCPSYKAQLANISEHLKSKETQIERLKDELNKLRVQLSTLKKEVSQVKSKSALVEAETENRFNVKTDSAIEISETAATPTQSSSESDSEDKVKRKPKKASKQKVPSKPRAAKSPRKRKQVVKSRREYKQEKQEEKEEEEEKEDEEEEEEEEEEEDEDEEEEEDGVQNVEVENERKTKTPKKKDGKGAGLKRKGRELVVGECREEKAPFVKVQEARMVTLANKGTQTSDYDRKATEGTTQREARGQPHGIRRTSLAESIMVKPSPNMVEEETNAAIMLIKEKADRLCDDISSFVDYGFELVQEGAKTTRMLTEAHAAELLESDDPTLQVDRAKVVKGQLSGDHRRQSVNAIKKRRPSIHLKRRGTVRRGSKLPFRDGITKDLQGEGVTKQDGNSDELATDSEAKHDGSSKGLEAENVTKLTQDNICEKFQGKSLSKDAEVESETKQEQSLDSTTKQKDETITGTDQRGTTNTTQQSPQAGRINIFFSGDDLRPVARFRGRSFSVSTPRPVTAESSKVLDSAFEKKSKWSTLRNFVESLRSHKGGGCSQVMNEVKSIVEGSVAMTPEDQVMGQITITAQRAIDSIQSTADIISSQLQEELGDYGKFCKIWSEVREKLNLHDPDGNDDVPVGGKKGSNTEKILATVDERDTDVIKTEESTFFPPISTQASDFQTEGLMPMAIAGLSQSGMMVIQAEAPGASEVIPPSTSLRKIMKKRGKVKNYSRKQFLLKKKAVMDKMLNVDTRIEDLSNLLSGMDRQKNHGINQHNKHSHAVYQGIPPAMSQDFYLPFTARSVAIPALPQGLQIQGATDLRPTKEDRVTKQASPREPVKDEKNKDGPLKLPGMNVNPFWQRKNSIVKFPSQKVRRKSFSEHQTKLPLLNMNQILKVGQAQE